MFAAVRLLTSGFKRRIPPRAVLFPSRAMSFGPPEEPTNFGKLFRIEPHRHKLELETFHAHPRDKHVVYDDEQHCYYFDGRRMKTSVTQKVDSYFKKFEADIIAERMMASSNWPRAGYIDRNGNPFTKEDILDKWYVVVV